MSVALIVFALGACRKEKQAAPQPAPTGSAQLAVIQDAAPGDAAPLDAAASTSVYLLEKVPSTIRVSSKVNNRTIKPEHIVDGDYNTAWNSATGELEGAWVEISVDGAAIDEVQLTVGHTGHGANGEDYFTMNPRIREVKLDDDGKPLGTFSLDITKRDLQAIRVAPKGTLRITVTAVEPGTKKTWREIAISEISVRGTPNPGWKAPKQPLVPNVIVDGLVEDAPDPCKGVDKERAEFERTHDYSNCHEQGCEDHNYPPDCGGMDLPQDLHELGAPWAGATVGCKVDDEIYGPKSCEIAFKAGARVASASFSQDLAKTEFTIEKMELADVIPGGRNELVIVMGYRGEHHLVVCRDAPVLDCSAEVNMDGKDVAGTIAAHPLQF